MRLLLAAAVSALLASCATPPPPEPPKPAPVAAPVAPEPPKKPLPPVAAIKPVTETFFGQAVTDPYRYMEDVKSAEITAFLRGQGEFARKALDAIPARQALLDRIGVLSEAGETVSGVQLTGDGNPRLV